MNRHLFICNAPPLGSLKLGDASVRILGIHHMIVSQRWDAFVVPPTNEDVLPLWQDVFGDRLLGDVSQLPDSHRYAHVHRIRDLDWAWGQQGWSIFDTIFIENGCLNIDLPVIPPVIYRCDHSSHSAMIYPDEHTEGNRVFTADAWLYIYNQLRALGLRINCLGAKASVALRPFYEEATFDAEYPPSISGMKECIARSSLAVGASTGPTWALLFSDIPQIVLFGRKSCHWDFDRIETIVAKRLHVFPTFASVASPLLGPGARLSPDLRRQVGEPGIRVAHSEFSSKHPHHPTPEVHLFDCRVGNLYEKWAASSGDGAWAEFIFERPTLLREVCVFHAGILEGPETNTRDYDISVWDEHAWVKAARVRANTDAVTRHPVSPILTDRVRLDVLKAGSDGGVRIYEIKFLE